MPNKKATNVAIRADNYEKLQYLRYWTKLPIQALVNHALGRFFGDRDTIEFLLRNGPGPVWLQASNPGEPPTPETPAEPQQLEPIRWVGGDELAQGNPYRQS